MAAALGVWLPAAIAAQTPAAAAQAQKVPAKDLIEMFRKHDPRLEQALRNTFPADLLKKGAAAAGERGEFIFAIESRARPQLQVRGISHARSADMVAVTVSASEQPRGVADEGLPNPLSAAQVGELWVNYGSLPMGSAYRYEWVASGTVIGGANDLAVYAVDSYAQAGVPSGKVSEKLTLESKVYPGMSANVWYWTPAQYDGSTPLPVQIWGDGQFYVEHPGDYHVFETLDNLIARKKIPPMVNVFIQPGMAGARALRSVEYDTVNDAYARYLTEEILPEIEKHVKLRHDGYSRAMVGESSGGICAFNAAFLKPDEFTRVLSWIGSFAALQVSEAEPAGGHVYPLRVRREAKRNIRVWLQDGAEDQENVRAGSWPLANMELANSLKIKGYDYHFSFGPGTHSQAQGKAELPESLVWLWRDYDFAKTSQDFTANPEEKDQPMWRVTGVNRR
jgi:enterochelin esterase family protein